jgi:hypothetical protein
MPHYTTFDANLPPPPAQVVKSPQAIMPKSPIQLAPQKSVEVSGEGSKQVFIKTLQGKNITVDADGMHKPGATPVINGYSASTSSTVKAPNNPQEIAYVVDVMPPINGADQKNINEPFPKASPAAQSSGGVGGLLFGNGSNGASSGTGGDSGTGATGGDGGRGGNGPAAN